MKQQRFLLSSFFVILAALASCTPPDDIVVDSEEEKVEENATIVSMWMMDFEEWENRINISQRKKFNADLTDGIQLEQTYINKNDFDDLIRSRYESGNVPDIYMVSYGNLYKEIKAGRAIDITQYFSDDSWNDLTDLAKTAVNYGGKYYAYPILMEPSTILAYRKDLLAKYAGADAKTPETWDELLSLCSTIRSALRSEGTKNVYPFSVPTGVACAWGTWGMQQAATGGLAVTDDWTTSRITEHGYTQLAGLWRDLYGNGYVPLSSGDYTEAVFDVADGKSVMATCGSWSISTILNQYPDQKDNIGFVPMPTFSGDKSLTTATNGGWCYVISSECKNIEAAAKVIRWLTAEDTAQAVDYFERAHYSKYSPRKSVQAILAQDYQKQNDVPQEWVETINDVAAKAILEPIYDWNISVAVEGLLEEAAMGNDITTAVKKCDSMVQGLCANAGTNPRL